VHDVPAARPCVFAGNRSGSGLPPPRQCAPLLFPPIHRVPKHTLLCGRWLRPLLLIVLAVIAPAACRDALDPDSTSEPRTEGPRLHAAPAGAWSGSAGIPIPANNYPSFGAVDTFRVATRDSIWVRMRMTGGGITLAINPLYEEYCERIGNIGTTCPTRFGGATFPYSGRQVSGQNAPALAVVASIENRSIPFDDSGEPAVYTYAWIGKGEVVRLRRWGMPGVGSCLSGMNCTPGSSFPGYFMTGGPQQLQMEEVHAPIHVSAPSHVLATDSATFTARTDIPINGTLWYFIPGDTLATPRNPDDSCRTGCSGALRGAVPAATSRPATDGCT
jgi:hypothetical protein